MDLTFYQRKITHAFLKLFINLSKIHRDFPKIDDSAVPKLSTTDTLFRHMVHIYLFIYYLFIYLFVCLFIYSSIFIYLFIYLFYPIIHLFILHFIIIKFVAIEDVINFSSLSRDNYFVFVKL